MASASLNRQQICAQRAFVGRATHQKRVAVSNCTSSLCAIGPNDQRIDPFGMIGAAKTHGASSPQ
jgi:hypothetical protein